MRNLLRRVMIAGGTAASVAAAMEWRRARRAGEVPFNRIRLAMNERVNPWLIKRGLVGGRHSEIATIEHIGRKTGITHSTPVHPTFVEDQVWIPLPYGETSQWAKNVIAAGHCRLQLHDTVYELDEPEIVPASEDPKLSRPATELAGWLGVKYLRLHRFGHHEGSLAAEHVAVPTLVPVPAPEHVEEATPIPV